jgi:hypothetical protein
MQLIETKMSLAVSYKIVTQSTMNRTKQRVSATVSMLTALGPTTFQNAQIKQFFFRKSNDLSKNIFNAFPAQNSLNEA